MPSFWDSSRSTQLKVYKVLRQLSPHHEWTQTFINTLKMFYRDLFILPTFLFKTHRTVLEEFSWNCNNISNHMRALSPWLRLALSPSILTAALGINTCQTSPLSPSLKKADARCDIWWLTGKKLPLLRYVTNTQALLRKQRLCLRPSTCSWQHDPEVLAWLKGWWPLGISGENIPIILLRRLAVAWPAPLCGLTLTLRNWEGNGEQETEPRAKERVRTELTGVMFIRTRGNWSTPFLHQKHSREWFLCWFLFFLKWDD